MKQTRPTFRQFDDGIYLVIGDRTHGPLPLTHGPNSRSPQPQSGPSWVPGFWRCVRAATGLVVTSSLMANANIALDHGAIGKSLLLTAASALAALYAVLNLKGTR